MLAEGKNIVNEPDSSSCSVLWWGVVSHFHITQPTMCQRATQTEIGLNVTASFACLCMHLTPFVQSAFSLDCICHIRFALHAVAEYFYLDSSFLFNSEALFVCQIRTLLLLRFCSHDLWIKWQEERESGRQLVLIGLVLVGAKGKMTFPCCLFWEGNRKNARAAVLILLADPTPVNSSLPLERHSPYSRRGARMYPSTVQCK